MIRSVFVSLAILASATPAVARAQSTGDHARAQALFREGKELRGADLYPAACVDFEESRRLEEGIGVTLYLADCWQRAGDLHRALTEFRRAEALARARGDRREAVARQRADALEPPVVSVAAAVPPPAPAPVPAMTPASPAPPPPPKPVVEERPVRPAPTAPLRPWIGGGLTALGAVGLGTGAALTAVAVSKHSQGAATGSTIAFATGAAAAAAGIVLILTAPRDGEPLTVAPAVMAGGAGAFLQGRF